MRKLILCILILSTVATLIYAQSLTIKISGIKNSKGNISLAFFKNSSSFKSESPAFTKIIKKSSVQNGCITVKYSDIKPGTYGVALLDDENRNGKMNYKFFIPKEGFGFSNYYHKGKKKPSFKDFSFLYGSSNKTISIKIKYM